MHAAMKLVKAFHERTGTFALSAHRLKVRGKVLPQTPISLSIEIEKGGAYLVVDATLSEISKAAQKRFKSAFTSNRRSGVAVKAETNTGVKISFSFFKERPTAVEETFTSPQRAYRLKCPIGAIEIHNGTGVIAGLHAVEDEHSSQEHSFEAHAAISSVRFDINNKFIGSGKPHPFHLEPEKKCGVTTRCLIGEIEGAQYCIEQHDGCLFFSLKGRLSEALSDPESILDGLMKASGFICGFEPWPFFKITKVGGKITRHTVEIPDDVQSKWRGPLPSGAAGPITADYVKMISCLATLLHKDNDECKYLNKLIWIARQPCRDSVPIHVRLLAVCSALEGLRKPFCNVKPGATDDKENKDEPKFRAMFKKACIPWKTVGKPAYDTWKNYRDPLSHGFMPTANQVSLNDYDDMIDSLHQLTNAFQLFVLRKAKYEGAARYLNKKKRTKVYVLRSSKKVRLPKAIRPFHSGSP
jgi:hypothetical protein